MFIFMQLRYVCSMRDRVLLTSLPHGFEGWAHILYDYSIGRICPPPHLHRIETVCVGSGSVRGPDSLINVATFRRVVAYLRGVALDHASPLAKIISFERR